MAVEHTVPAILAQLGALPTPEGGGVGDGGGVGEGRGWGADV